MEMFVESAQSQGIQNAPSESPGRQAQNLGMISICNLDDLLCITSIRISLDVSNIYLNQIVEKSYIHNSYMLF